jgi:hypothetical protein
MKQMTEAWAFVAVFLLFTSIPAAFLCHHRIATTIHFKKESKSLVDDHVHDNILIEDVLSEIELQVVEEFVRVEINTDAKIDPTTVKNDYLERMEGPELLLSVIVRTKDEVEEFVRVEIIDAKLDPDPTTVHDDYLGGMEDPEILSILTPTKDEVEEYVEVEIIVGQKINETKEEDLELVEESRSSIHNEEENGLFYFWAQILYLANRVVLYVWNKV